MSETYNVNLLVIPIDYTRKETHAIAQHNDKAPDIQLTELDKDILAVLEEANKGLTTNQVMKAARRSVFRGKLYGSIYRLLAFKYIVRTEYRKSVYYSITLEGRAVLDELNEILISIVHNRPL